jgi:hypothetical protein
MAKTYTPIATQTLTTSAASVTFSSIPGTYTDLVLIVSSRSLKAGTEDALFIQVNGDSSTLYSRTELYNASSGRATGETAYKYHGKVAGNTSGGATFATSNINFMNYANTATFKTLIARCGMADPAYTEVKTSVGLYRSTNAISSMVLTTESATNFAPGSSFTLYGILKA